jgi:hypothetical protein
MDTPGRPGRSGAGRSVIDCRLTDDRKARLSAVDDSDFHAALRSSLPASSEDLSANKTAAIGTEISAPRYCGPHPCIELLRGQETELRAALRSATFS